MSVSTVKTENGNVSCETPDGTVVHININQRSSLDCLLDTFRFFRDLKKNGEKTAKPSRMSGPAAQLGFGASFASLGLVFVMLAIITSVVQPSLTIFYCGLHYWVGLPFLVSGALNLAAYKFTKKCWMVLSFISLFVSLGVSIAGIILTSSDMNHYYWIVNERICDNLRDNGGYYYGGQPTRNYYGYDYELSNCREAIQKYKSLVIGLLFMTLLLSIWGLLLSIFNVGFRLNSYCQAKKTEVDEECLLKPDPSDDIIIA
ncbi:uncharacterized protein RB166_018501 [Leptodactylus fuscus]|uniref:uncharacterized protein LOC142183470 n=1 Tax=Leptodactylus fuscus TaxID=238119 RepID=UPI003F4F043A